MIEGYMSIKEASELWNVTPRRIQAYCMEGRIEGAAKLGREWAIPTSAEKPGDKRVHIVTGGKMKQKKMEQVMKIKKPELPNIIDGVCSMIQSLSAS